MNAIRGALILLALVVCAARDAAAASPAAHRFGGLTVFVDDGDAFPGGIVTVRLASRRPLRGIVYGILDGRRCPAFLAREGMRVLVPVPVTFSPGRTTLGVEIRSGGGRRRYAVPVTIAPRVYPPREIVLPEDKRATAAASPTGVRDGRLLLEHLRTVSPRQQWRAPFRPPVDVPPADTFGAPQTWVGAVAVESTMDSVHGEYHRGLDYEVPVGTPVKAPAAGTVLFSGPLALSGRTVVVDHGQGLLSVFAHLAEASVRQGEEIDAGRMLGTSGDSGVAAAPHLHWGVYLHGVAIDPRVTERF